MEWLKDISDQVVIWLLRSTSGFGKELTADGKKEQRQWREQRWRNLQGLAQRWRQRSGDKEIAT